RAGLDARVDDGDRGTCLRSQCDRIDGTSFGDDAHAIDRLDEAVADPLEPATGLGVQLRTVNIEDAHSEVVGDGDPPDAVVVLGGPVVPRRGLVVGDLDRGSVDRIDVGVTL